MKKREQLFYTPFLYVKEEAIRPHCIQLLEPTNQAGKSLSTLFLLSMGFSVIRAPFLDPKEAQGNNL